jgi:hypothetical protein
LHSGGQLYRLGQLNALLTLVMTDSRPNHGGTCPLPWPQNSQLRSCIRR